MQLLIHRRIRSKCLKKHPEDTHYTKQHKHSVLHRHQQEKHNNNRVTYNAKVITTYPTSALRLQVAEGVYINIIPPGMMAVG